MLIGYRGDLHDNSCRKMDLFATISARAIRGTFIHALKHAPSNNSTWVLYDWIQSIFEDGQY